MMRAVAAENTTAPPAMTSCERLRKCPLLAERDRKASFAVSTVMNGVVGNPLSLLDPVLQNRGNAIEEGGYKGTNLADRLVR